MTLNQNYTLLQIVDGILSNCELYDEDKFCTNESLIFSFSCEQKKELEKIFKELAKRCKYLS